MQKSASLKSFEPVTSAVLARQAPRAEVFPSLKPQLSHMWAGVVFLGELTRL